jgi:hypothetical protein
VGLPVLNNVSRQFWEKHTQKTKWQISWFDIDDKPGCNEIAEVVASSGVNFCH